MLTVRKRRSRNKKQASQKAGVTIQIIEHNFCVQEMKYAFILWHKISDILSYLFLQLSETDFENGVTPGN